MNVARILAQLKAERRRLNVAIAALERLVEPVQKQVKPTNRRSPAERKRRSTSRRGAVRGTLLQFRLPRTIPRSKPDQAEEA